MAQETYDRSFVADITERELDHAAGDHDYGWFRHDNSPALSAGRASAWSSMNAPRTCTDGSLVIDADGRVRQATPEQQRIALNARAARAQAGRDEDLEALTIGH